MTSTYYNWEDEYYKDKDSIQRYLGSRIIYICDCGRGTKIKNNTVSRVVEVKDGMCIHCGHVAMSRRVPTHWNAEMGLYKIRGRVQCYDA